MASLKPIVAVADDDAAVRNSLKFSLEIDGFVVRAYAGAEELLRSGDLDTCQCLVVDQNMPRMAGLELVSVLRRQGLDVPAILISGHVTPAVTRQASAAGIPVIEKPFLGNALIELIRSATAVRRDESDLAP